MHEINNKLITMKTIVQFYYVIGMLILMSSCVIDDAFDCEHGRGDLETESFILNDFSEVKLRTDASVFITQGDGHSVDLIAQRNIANELEFKVRGGTLTIDNDRCLRNYKDI